MRLPLPHHVLTSIVGSRPRTVYLPSPVDDLAANSVVHTSALQPPAGHLDDGFRPHPKRAATQPGVQLLCWWRDLVVKRGYLGLLTWSAAASEPFVALA
jgi:hypothetical protein